MANHDRPFDLEGLLTADSEVLHQQTQIRLQSGLKLRLATSLTPSSAPSYASMHRWSVALAAAVIVVLAAMMATRADRHLPSAGAPPIASAPQTPKANVASALPQRAAPSTARVHIRKASTKVVKLVHSTAPFPAPTPLSPEEHMLMQIARAEPQERLLIYTQQQQMTEDYLRGIQEFKSRVANQGDSNER